MCYTGRSIDFGTAQETTNKKSILPTKVAGAHVIVVYQRSTMGQRELYSCQGICVGCCHGRLWLNMDTVVRALLGFIRYYYSRIATYTCPATSISTLIHMYVCESKLIKICTHTHSHLLRSTHTHVCIHNITQAHTQEGMHLLSRSLDHFKRWKLLVGK